MKPVNRKLDRLPLTFLNKPNFWNRRTFRQLMDKSTKDQHKSKEIEWHFVSAMRWDGPDGDQRETLNHFTCRQPVEIKHFILSSLQQYANFQWMRWFPFKQNIFFFRNNWAGYATKALHSWKVKMKFKLFHLFASFRDL